MSDAPVLARPMGARRMWSGMPKADTSGTATPRSSWHRCTIRRWMALALLGAMYSSFLSRDSRNIVEEH